MRYGAVTALAGVDLDAGAGEVVALVGANGSGKTTLLRIVAGLSRPASGSVVVLGHPAGSRPARAAVAFVPDEPAGLDELTLAEHVGLMRSLARASADPGEDALAALGLDPWRHVRLGALSRGLRRRGALASALAGDPEVLLLDEATVTLDGGAVDALVAILRARAYAGRVSLVASHDLGFVERACDRAVVLGHGTIVGAGPAAVAGVLGALPARPAALATTGGEIGAAARARSHS